MKKQYYSFAALFLLAGGIFSVNAQDLIALRDGNIIEARVIEISPTEIRYNRFDHLDGPVIVIPAASVLSIRFENGMVEIIRAAPLQPLQPAARAERPPRTIPIVNSIGVDLMAGWDFLSWERGNSEWSQRTRSLGPEIYMKLNLSYNWLFETRLFYSGLRRTENNWSGRDWNLWGVNLSLLREFSNLSVETMFHFVSGEQTWRDRYSFSSLGGSLSLSGVYRFLSFETMLQYVNPRIALRSYIWSVYLELLGRYAFEFNQITLTPFAGFCYYMDLGWRWGAVRRRVIDNLWLRLGSEFDFNLNQNMTITSKLLYDIFLHQRSISRNFDSYSQHRPSLRVGLKYSF